jgi:23S rRNA (pseudouridine1915-N3)-methyltransferase
MLITIITPGKMNKNFRVIFDEYLKRCKTKINLVEFSISEAISERRIDSESDIILKHLLKLDSKIICLMSIDGELISSNDLAQKLQFYKNSSVKNLIFIIGGAYGINKSVKNIANTELSFGRNTWPHDLMKVMLMEQIFRAESILDGKNYHH